MNNNTGTLQLHPLLASLLANQGKNVSDTANQILNGTDSGQQLQNREAYLNYAHAHAQDTLSNLLHNNPGGYVTNAAPLQGNQNANVQTDNSMTLNALLGIISQAAGMQNNAVQSATSISNNANDNAIKQQELNLNKANAGWTDINGNPASTTGGGSGNARVDTWAQAVMSGQKGINEIPSELSMLVLQELNRQGYDAGRAIRGDLGNLMSSFGAGTDSLAAGNNPGQTVKRDLGSLLDYITRGGMQTGTQQRTKSYREAADNFKSKWGSVLGKNIDLPSDNDTAKVAAEKWNKITKQIQNYYYQGGAGPNNGKKPSLDQFNR